MRRVALIVIVMLMSSPFVMAEGFAIGAKAGTLGLGAEMTVGLSERANLRLGMNGASIDLSGLTDNDDSTTSAEEIDLTLDLSTIAALLDWHVWAGGFRLTAGAMLNNNEINMSVDVSETVEIGDKTYRVDDLDGSVGFGSIAPYLGIGYGNAVDKDGRFTFALDLGVMLQGSPEVDINATASDPRLQSSLNAELVKEEQNIEDDVKGMTVYPVISLGLACRF